MTIAIPARGRRAYVISAFQSDRSLAENMRAQRQLLSFLAADVASGHLAAILYCDGAYKGTPEESVLVLAEGSANAFIEDMGRMFKQESILRITRHGEGVLHFMDGSPAVVIGRLHHLKDYAPGDAEAWTTIRATGETFTFV